MSSAAAIGQKWKNEWKRAASASLTIALLLAVAVVGISLFGSEVVAAWKKPGNAERALPSGGVLADLLNFDAPAQTLARVNVQTAESEQSIQRTADVSLLVKNWKFTQNPIVDFLQSLGPAIQASQAAVANAINQINQLVAAEFSALAAFINAVLTAYANFINSFASSFVNVSTTINQTNINSSSSSQSSHSASPHH